eukprot:7745801-Lingulodinium_polyedra.AAC.1
MVTAVQISRLCILVRQYCFSDSSSGRQELAINTNSLEELLATFSSHDPNVVRRRVRAATRDQNLKLLMLPSGSFKCLIIPALACQLGIAIPVG